MESLREHFGVALDLVQCHTMCNLHSPGRTSCAPRVAIGEQGLLGHTRPCVGKLAATAGHGGEAFETENLDGARSRLLDNDLHVHAVGADNKDLGAQEVQRLQVPRRLGVLVPSVLTQREHGHTATHGSDVNREPIAATLHQCAKGPPRERLYATIPHQHRRKPHRGVRQLCVCHRRSGRVDRSWVPRTRRRETINDFMEATCPHRR
mmetsp:Transcript_110565/g.311840  ORF Transcript_110565/g.311840 Transcript_110565/m.311840 type:complete len:207 (-) Transcript_110565:138-758(-)